MIDTSSPVRLLFCADSALLGEQIARALQVLGYSVLFSGADDHSDASQKPARQAPIATVVIWSPESLQDADLLAAAEQALQDRLLCPVTFKRTAPPKAFASLAPVDLVGWSGAEADPRWRFMLEDIKIAAKRAQAQNLDPQNAITNDTLAKSSADATPPSLASPSATPSQRHPFDWTPPAKADPGALRGDRHHRAVTPADGQSKAGVWMAEDHGALFQSRHDADGFSPDDRSTGARVDADIFEKDPYHEERESAYSPLIASRPSLAIHEEPTPQNTPAFRTSTIRIIAGAAASLLLAIGAAGLFMGNVGSSPSADSGQRDDAASIMASTPSDLPRFIDPPPVVAFVEPATAASPKKNEPPTLRETSPRLEEKSPLSVEQFSSAQGKSEAPETMTTLATSAPTTSETANLPPSGEAVATNETVWSELTPLEATPPAEESSLYDAVEETPAPLAPAPLTKENRLAAFDIEPTLKPAAPPKAINDSQQDAPPGNADVIAQLAWSSISEAPTGDALSSTAGAPANEGSSSDAVPSEQRDIASLIEDTEPTAGLYFRDCLECPDMAELPAGAFVMGAPINEAARTPEEGPQVTVTLRRPFALGAREVTFDEWDACVAAGGCRRYRPRDAGWGRGRKPVINVSYEDALDYIAWLSSRTGRRYRLPSESEWEFAARAGAQTPFNTGDTITAAQANYHGEYPYGTAPGRYRRRTANTGSFAPNAFGLYDVHGNVWEWTADCWRPTHEGAPLDGRPVDSSIAQDDCEARVIKGGAWNAGAWRARAGYRRAAAAKARDFATGFRVARDL